MGVTGIGGFFFRAKDPEAVRAWYVEHLGVGSIPYGAWDTAAGPSVFAPFRGDDDYFAADRQWMLNLRVDDLDCAVREAACGRHRRHHQAGMGHARRRALRAHP